MAPLKIGLQLASLRMPLSKGLHTAARLGAGGVEIDARHELRPRELSETGLRQVRKMLDDLNLRVVAVSFLTRRGYQVAEDFERRIEATREAMRMARSLGCGVVVNQIGRVPENADDPDAQRLVDALKELGRWGVHEGALLAAQTGSESGPALAKFLDTLPEGTIGVDLDPAGLIVNGFSASEAVQSLGPRIVHVHARDAVRDRTRGRGLEVALGQGSADFPEMAAMLEQHSYRGYFTVARDNSPRPEEELGQAVQYLRSLG